MHRQHTALYISAWNPDGQLRSRVSNVRVNKRLERDLHKLTEHVWYGVGRSRDGSWKEESFLALGLSLRDSRRLGRKYRQVAVVWVGRTGIPRLVMTLRGADRCCEGGAVGFSQRRVTGKSQEKSTAPPSPPTIGSADPSACCPGPRSRTPGGPRGIHRA
ncbi:MAG: DUF3293 domain-containing protein [Planctomycetota bacterium]